MSPEQVLGGALLSLILGVGVFILARGQHRRAKKRSLHRVNIPRALPHERLSAHLRERNDLLVYVGVPTRSPECWAKAYPIDPVCLMIEGHGPVPVCEVSTCLITYPDGQLLDSFGKHLPLPEGIRELSPQEVTSPEHLSESELQQGNALVTVIHGECRTRPGVPGYYATRLSNLSGERIRVLRFGGYAAVRSAWVLDAKIGCAYSAEDFISWYGANADGWILPDQMVCDGNNWSAAPTLWAYHIETESGLRFVCGAVSHRG